MSIAITTRLSPTSYTNQLRADVRSGLTGSPKSIPPKYFYDGRGSALFDQITKLPEYYPTRAERSILAAHARDIAILTRAQTLTELGSGTSDKTRLLLDALHRGGPLRRFEPFDVDPDMLAEAGAAVAADYPGLEVRGVVGDFQHHLGLQSGGGRRLIAFLGSTIGNFPPTQRAQFLTAVRSALGPGDSFLLGTDLVKDEVRLVAAYDDAAGVTAAFNRNVLVVLNRELGADFDVHGFDHVARWDAEQEWIEMQLRSTRSQTVHLADLDLDVSFHTGEAILTEISVKFRRETVQDELFLAGLQLERWWTDPAGDFALSLYRPR